MPKPYGCTKSLMEKLINVYELVTGFLYNDKKLAFRAFESKPLKCIFARNCEGTEPLRVFYDSTLCRQVITSQ